jgi:hypothetical protein
MRAGLVDFVVAGLDDRGQPSGNFLKVAEVALVDRQGREIGRYRDANRLGLALMRLRRRLRLVAVEIVGEPRARLRGRFCCDEQAWADAFPRGGANRTGPS